MDATDQVAQTLTCNIGMVTQAVEVSWKDTSDVDIDNGGDYTITQGTVDPGTNIQESTLTISATKLQSLTTTSPLTWKCAAKSTLYTTSEQSEFQNVVVTFLTFGEFYLSAGFDTLTKVSIQNNSHFIYFSRKGYHETGNLLNAHCTLFGL